MNSIKNILGNLLAGYLQKELKSYRKLAHHDLSLIREHLQPADILLVEGNLRVSTAIKYLTQSTWSHSALYVGDVLGDTDEDGNPKVLIEADLKHGVIGVPLEKFSGLNTRICRAVGLSPEDKMKVIGYMMKSLGKSYDLKHVFDLLRYLFPTPPVPARFRRKLIALGSGDPTRAICSSLIAQAFHSVNYPILPSVVDSNKYPQYSDQEILHIRHYSLFAPRDFDLSPYFEVIKPTVERGFDFHSFVWAHVLDRENPPEENLDNGTQVPQQACNSTSDRG